MNICILSTRGPFVVRKYTHANIIRKEKDRPLSLTIAEPLLRNLGLSLI